jgi:hypothetical protein
MDVAELINLVSAALRSAPFRISGATMQSEPVTTLLRGHLGADALVLNGGAEAGRDAASITVTGTLAGVPENGPVRGLAGLTASARFTVADGVAQVRVTLTGLPASWTPSAAVPALAGTVLDAVGYTSPWIALDSANADALPAGFPDRYGFAVFSAETAASLVRGLSVGGIAELSGLPADLGPLAGSSWQLSGEVALLPSAAAACLRAAPSAHPFSVAGYEIPFSVALAVAPQPVPAPPVPARPGTADGANHPAPLPTMVSSLIQFEADIEKNVGTAAAPHVIRLPVLLRTAPYVSGVYALGAALPGTVPITIRELAELVDGHALDAQVPTAGDFPALDDIVLEDISVVFAPAAKDPLVSISATVALANPHPDGWQVFGGLIAFKGMSVCFSYSRAVDELITEVTAAAVLAGGTLDASVSLPDLTFDLALAEGSSIDVTKLIRQLTGSSVSMQQITCPAFELTGDVLARSYSFQADVAGTWGFTIGGKPFTLDQIGLSLNYDGQAAAGHAVSGQAIGVFTVAGLDLYVIAAYDGTTSTWSFEGGTIVPASIEITHLAAGLTAELGIDIPAGHAPAGLTLQNLNVSYDTGTGELGFAGLADFEVAGVRCELGVFIDRSASQTTFTGTLWIGLQAFEIDFSTSNHATVLSGSWSAEDSDGGIDLIALVEGLGFEPPKLPADLDLRLASASFSYDITTGAFTIQATSSAGNKAVFAAVPVDRKTEFFFGLSIGTLPGLGDLPVVGGALAAALAIEDVLVVLSSQPMTPPIVDALSRVLQGSPIQPPHDGTADKIALSVTLDLAGTKLPLAIGMGQPQSTGSNTIVPAPPAGSPVPPATPPGATDGTTWFTVQRTIGPLTLRRAGVRYADGALGIVLDASLSAGGLDITLLGLAISTPLSTFRPALSLDGLGIEFSRPPLAVGGAFARIMPPPAGTSWEYGGGGVVSVPEFQLSALGAFADLHGQPSMFVFARLNAELGGPPACFVTGIAAGFGYNSALRIPAQDQVTGFPLVAGAAGPSGLGGGSDPLAALAALTSGPQPWVSSALGELWAAAGISFTSFDLVQTNALLVAEFGADLIVALLGLSTAKFPRTGPKVYAQAQLELEVVVDAGAGTFAATALLAPDSYLLDPACALTGGFAFCFWFGPNPHAGDFALTLGGYSPYFTAPAWYPREPRVGFSWHVSSTTTVSGTAYFALTPAAIMAGGELAVNFHDGNLTAWLTAHADVIAWWEPFHFRASFGVSIGASYTFNFWFTSKTVTIELGADVDLWGPPTGGTATVHYWILSFTVSFGEGPTDNPQPLTWTDFKQLLPAAPLQLSATAGLAGLETEQDGTHTWIVRSGSFAFTSRSTVPATSIAFGDDPPLAADADHIAITPMQTTATSHHTVSIYRDGVKLAAPPCTRTPVSTGVPAAMWGPGDGRTLTAPDKQLVDGLLTGMNVAVNPPVLAASPGVISLADALGYDTLPPRPRTPVTAGAAPAGPVPQAGTDTIGAIKRGIGSDPVTTARDNLHGVLTTLGFTTLKDAPMTEFARQADTLFTDEPLQVPA